MTRTPQRALANIRSLTNRSVEELRPGERMWDDKVAGLCARCQGRAKVFGLQVRVRGTQRWITIGRWGVLTPDQARQKARVLLGRLASGEDVVGQRQRFKTLPSVDELADEFIAQHVLPKLKVRTASEYVRLLKSCIKSPGPAMAPRDARGRPSRKRPQRPRLGSLRADAVIAADVLRFHNALADMPYEANRALAVLSKLMSFAEQQGVRPRGSNPCRGIAKFKEHRRERFLSEREFGKLADAMQVLEESGRVSGFALAAIRLLILTGARREEVRTLRWSYIDEERGLAFLPDSKTGRKTLQLSVTALELLARLPRLQHNPYVFPGRGSESGDEASSRPIRSLQMAWEQLRVLAGFPDLRIHDLRHSYASLLAANGTPLLVVGKLLGHRHTATTERYAHLSDDPVRLANERVGAQLARPLQIGFHRQLAFRDRPSGGK
jgi:integrase